MGKFQRLVENIRSSAYGVFMSLELNVNKGHRLHNADNITATHTVYGRTATKDYFHY